MLSQTITADQACQAGKTVAKLYDAMDPNKRAEMLEEADAALALLKAVEIDAAKEGHPYFGKQIFVTRHFPVPSLN